MRNVTDSILLTIKKMLGIAEEYHAFDIDLIVNINSVFLTLNQLGVGPEVPYQINGEKETWKDFLKRDGQKFSGVETYVYLKTRLLFDPPTNSFLVEAIEKQCNELEWRLNVQAEGGMKSGNVPGHDDAVGGTCGAESGYNYESGLLRSMWKKRFESDPEDSFEGDPDELRLLRASWHKGNEMGD